MRWPVYFISKARQPVVFHGFSALSVRSSSSFSTSSTNDFDRALQPIPAEEIRKRNETFEAPADSRIAKTVIIGCPNAGKSVLTNALVNAPVSAVSSKVHTTRKTTRGACLLNDRTQLLVYDTPGVVTSTRAKKHNLENSLLTDPDGAMLGGHTVCVLLDASDKHTRDRLDPRILHLLYRHRYRLTSALVLTKMDALKDKGMLLSLGTKLTKGIVGGKPVPAKQVDSILIRGGEKPSSKGSDFGQTGKIEYIDAASTGGLVNPISEGSAESDDVGESRLAAVTEPSPLDDTLRKYWTGVRWDLIEKMTTTPWPDVQESMLQKCYRNEVGWPLFDRLFMVSGLTGDGVDDLREYLNERAEFGRWRFPPSVITDQQPEEMVMDIVRAKLMDRLKYHIPYTLDFKVRNRDSQLI